WDVKKKEIIDLENRWDVLETVLMLTLGKADGMFQEFVNFMKVLWKIIIKNSVVL
ncbi:unnamed protein product, partial [Allacma fusca]